jgi:hypothetical protein
VKKIIPGIVCCVLFTVAACVKQTNYPLYPILTTITVSRTSASEFFANANGADSILVTMGFTDGEGGIGPVPTGIDPDSFPLNSLCNHAYDSLIIADPFYNVYWYEYHASQFGSDSCLGKLQTAYIADNPKNKSIGGIIQVYAPIECAPSGNVDTVYFSYFFKDRLGKISNRLRTPSIVITCQ